MESMDEKRKYKTIILTPEIYLKLLERKNKKSTELERPISFCEFIDMLLEGKS